MAKYSKEIQIDSDLKTIWMVLIDVENWHQWTNTITSIKNLNSTTIQNGTKLRIVQPRLPDAIWKVFLADDERSFFFKKRNWLLTVVAGHELQPFKDGTIVTLSIEFSGMSADWVARKYGTMMEEYLAVETRGLKDTCEAKTKT